jgi:hypothetical protein
MPGTHIEYQDPALEIDRIVCPPTVACEAAATPARSLLVPLTDLKIQPPAAGKRSFGVGQVIWLPGNAKNPLQLTPGAQVLRVTLLYPN